jgi:hypothetical protein
MNSLSKSLTWNLASTRWASTLNNVLANPLTNPVIIEEIKLVTGENTINHTIGRQLQGWFLTDLNAPVSVYRSQPLNPLTLTLTSSGPATCNIVVF